MKFALIALLLTNGQTDAYKIDSGLSFEDCKAAISSPLPSDLPTDLAATLKAARLVCEAE